MKKAFFLLLFFLSVLFSANTVTGAEVSGLTIAPGKHDFGFFGAGSTSGPAIFTITNHGPQPLKILKISIANQSAYSAEVEGGPNPCGKVFPTLAAGESCTVSVRFHPFDTGVINGALQVGSDLPGVTETVSLTGFGIACGC